MIDYKIDVELLNSVPQSSAGSKLQTDMGTYFGTFVEKGFDEFTIYVVFSADDNSEGSINNPMFPAPHSFTITSGGKKKQTTTVTTVSQRDGERFSGFLVMADDVLYSNPAPLGGTQRGYLGNPRVAKCTYPTIMWSMTGIGPDLAPFHYGNLNSTNPVITIKS